MTDSLRKAAEMALAKLDHLWEIGIDAEYKVELLPEIHALRQALAQPDSSCNGMPAYEGYLSKSQALAQPEQEPVAWFSILPDNSLSIKISGKPTTGNWEPLYTAPPKREWQGLTDEDIEEVERWIEFKEEGSGRIPESKLIRYIEAKLKEKNT